MPKLKIHAPPVPKALKPRPVRPGNGPLVGPYLSDFLRAGPEFGATTLSRFYAIHMLLLPGAIIALIGAHLYLVTKLGTTAPPWLKAEQESELREETA